MISTERDQTKMLATLFEDISKTVSDFRPDVAKEMQTVLEFQDIIGVLTSVND